jgi:hypothetical protein
MQLKKHQWTFTPLSILHTQHRYCHHPTTTFIYIYIYVCMYIYIYIFNLFIQQIYLLNFFKHPAQSPLFPPSTKCHLFLNVILLVHKMVMFHIKDELKFKWPAPEHKGSKVNLKYVYSYTNERTDVHHTDKIKTLQHSTCVRNSGSSSLRSLHWISPALFMARVCLCQSFRLYESNLLFTLFSSFFSICSLPSCKSAQSVNQQVTSTKQCWTEIKCWCPSNKPATTI